MKQRTPITVEAVTGVESITAEAAIDPQINCALVGLWTQGKTAHDMPQLQSFNGQGRILRPE
jgi:hypothetical protein